MAGQPSEIPAATDARAAGTARYSLTPTKEEPQNLENQESGSSSKDVLGMTIVGEAAVRRNTLPNISTASITVTASPNLFGPELTNCQRCGKPFEPRQGGRKAQRYCSAECRKGRIRNDQTNAERTTTNAEVVGNGVGVDLGDSDKSYFAWADEDVAIPAQAMTAAYRNAEGGLVIRQQVIDCWQGEEPIIIISKENIPAFLDRLGVLCDDCCDDDSPFGGSSA
jgi:hypothetical protein